MMSNLNIAFIGPENLAKELGKQGTSSDITFYNLKKGETTLTIIRTSRYPDKISSLFYSVSLAKFALVVIDEINATLGETILMLNAVGISEGIFVLRNYIDQNQIAPIIRGTLLENYHVFPDDKTALREWLIDRASKEMPVTGDSKGIVPVDHHFPVKGIGTVVLGCVQAGCIRRHDNVRVLPTGKQIQIRSIQMHDDDTDIACQGDRVGLALKGIEAEELDRGYVITSDPGVQYSTEVKGPAEIIPYWPEPLKEQMVLYAGHWMQFLPCRVSSVIYGKDFRKPEIELVFDQEFIFVPGSRVILHYLENEKLRIVGTLRIS